MVLFHVQTSTKLRNRDIIAMFIACTVLKLPIALLRYDENLSS